MLLGSIWESAASLCMDLIALYGFNCSNRKDKGSLYKIKINYGVQYRTRHSNLYFKCWPWTFFHRKNIVRLDDDAITSAVKSRYLERQNMARWLDRCYSGISNSSSSLRRQNFEDLTDCNLIYVTARKLERNYFSSLILKLDLLQIYLLNRTQNWTQLRFYSRKIIYLGKTLAESLLWWQ